MNGTVLVVDDDPAVLDSLQLLLGAAGLETQGFSSASDFLERWNGERVGCLVVDVRLPGMSGIDLVRRLCAEGRGLPTILITGHLATVPDPGVGGDGILAILHKPFTAEELLGWVERALDSLASEEP